jgi:exonuclease SbcC
LADTQRQLRDNQIWLENLQKLQAQQAALAAEQATVETENQALQTDLARLAAHRQTLPLRAPLQRLQTLENEKNELAQAAAHLDQNAAEHARARAVTEQNLRDTEQSLGEAQQNLRDAEATFEKVIQLDTRLQSEADTLQNLRADAARFLAETSDLQQKIQEASTAQTRVGAEIQALQNWLQLRKNLQQFGENLPKVEAYIAHIQQLTPEGAQLRARQTAAAIESQQLAQAEEEHQILEQKATQALAAAQADWQQFLQKNQLPKSERAAENTLDERIENATQNLQQLEDFARYFRDYRRVADELEKAETKQRDLDAQTQNLAETLVELLEREIPALQARCRTKRDRYELQQQALRVSDLRAQLSPGQPCPVCGAEHHPLAAHHLDPTALEDDARQELEAAEAALLDAQKRQAALESQHQTLQKNLLEINDLLDQNLRREIAQLHADICQCEPDPAKLTALLAALPAQQTNALREKTTAQRLEKEHIEQLRSQFNEHLRGIRSRQTEQAQAETALREVRTRRQLNDRDRSSLSEQLERWAEALRAETAALDPLLAPFGFAYSAEKNFGEKFDALHRDAKQFAAKAKELDQLLRENEARDIKIGTQKTQLDDRLDEVETRQKNLDAAAERLETLHTTRVSIFGNKNPQAERAALNARMDELSAALRHWQAAQKNDIARTAELAEGQKSNLQNQQKNQAERTQIHADIAAALQKMGFASTDALLAAVLPDEIAAQIEKTAEQLRTRQAALLQNQRDTEAQLARESQRDFAWRDAAALRSESATNEAALHQTQQQIGALQNQLAENERLGQQAENLLQQIENQRIELNRWEALRKLIGSNDGAAFRKFAQSLTLQQLVQRANQHLSHLQGGRYRLQKRLAADLDLEIVDTFQADYARSVNTLSGGETFLASLALALGLADMSGGQASQVQSLFIDEGFGSLDENALEMAIATLESLEARGTTIGIISHVRELKARIATQVWVERRSDGFSEVRVG